jgi:hypothetical protein
VQSNNQEEREQRVRRYRHAEKKKEAGKILTQRDKAATAVTSFLATPDHPPISLYK